jgi:hypothetical protein
MASASWNIDPAKFIQVAENDLTDMMKTITLDAFGMIIRMSPVDTGAFRGNNRVSIGRPDNSYDVTKTSQANKAEGEQAIASISVPYTTVYIQNNLPYADRLENGSSMQAPAGLYGITYNSIAQKYGR